MNIDITCKNAVDYISRKEEGKLSFWKRVQLWRHLMVCSLCRRFAKQNSDIGRMFNSVPDRRLTEEEKKVIADSVLGNQKHEN